MSCEWRRNKVTLSRRSDAPTGAAAEADDEDEDDDPEEEDEKDADAKDAVVTA